MAAGDGPAKAAAAFRTIGELSRDTGLPPHILRYWETRFTQLRPVTRAGNRRYYRPDDVQLVQRIDALLNREGYTIRGVQQLLAREGGVIAGGAAPDDGNDNAPKSLADLVAIRDTLAKALQADAR
jgi:DNA-binding transcriptional MerR regulator